MDIAFDSRVRMPGSVLIREISRESVILNLDTECYYGLDDVGTRFWTVLTSSESIQAACELLQQEWAVSPDELRHDVAHLVADLAEQGLLSIEPAAGRR